MTRFEVEAAVEMANEGHWEPWLDMLRADEHRVRYSPRPVRGFLAFDVATEDGGVTVVRENDRMVVEQP